MELIEKLQASLPFEVCFDRHIIAHLKKEGKNIQINGKYSVTDVYDSGNIGGIVCVIPYENEAIVISITHLAIDNSHPLSIDVKKYQQERLRELNK